MVAGNSAQAASSAPASSSAAPSLMTISIDRPVRQGTVSTITIKCVTKTGNELQDQDLEAQFEQLQGVVTALVSDTSHIQPISGTLAKRAQLKQAIGGNAANSLFDEKIASVKTLPEAFLIAWIADHSDLTQEDCSKVLGKNSEGLVILFGHATQLPPHFQIVGLMRNIPVAERVSAKLDEECGKRLQHIKRDGHMGPDGSLRLASLSYNMEFVAHATADMPDVLSKITHVASKATVDVKEDAGLTRRWGIRNHTLDHYAALVMEPHQPIKLTKFFIKPNGPWSLKQYTVSSKPWKDLTEACHKEWLQAVESSKSKVKSLDQTAQQELDKQVETRKRRTSDQLRAKADERLAKRREKDTQQLADM